MRHELTTERLLVGPREAAEMLGVSARKLWTMTFEDRPGLPYLRAGRLVRYSISDLRDWVASQRRGGQADDQRG